MCSRSRLKKIEKRTNEKESKKEERKNEKSIQDLRDDAEKACLMHETLRDESTCVEVQHELLVDKSKDELCRIKHESQDEWYLDVDKIRKEIDKELVENARDECFEKHMNLKLKEIEKEEKHEIGDEKEVENEEVDNCDEQSEVESEDLLCKLFDGWIVSF